MELERAETAAVGGPEAGGPPARARRPAARDAPPRAGRQGALHAMHAALAVMAGFSLLGALCLIWTLILPLPALLLSRPAARTLGRHAIGRVFRAYLGFLVLIGGLRLRLEALDTLRGQGPLILAPNHPGLLDAVLILSRLPTLACVVKESLLDNPWLGPGARLAGYIGNAGRQGMIHAAVDELRAGHSLLLFPEGTRTTRPPVNPFTSGLGIIAKKAGVPIQPVFIEMDQPLLGKHRPWWRLPALPVEIRVRLGQRVAPPTEVRHATARLWAIFAGELGGSAAMPPCPDAPTDPRP